MTRSEIIEKIKEKLKTSPNTRLPERFIALTYDQKRSLFDALYAYQRRELFDGLDTYQRRELFGVLTDTQLIEWLHQLD